MLGRVWPITLEGTKKAATAIFEEWGLERHGSTPSDAPEGR